MVLMMSVMILRSAFVQCAPQGMALLPDLSHSLMGCFWHPTITTPLAHSEAGHLMATAYMAGPTSAESQTRAEP
jgi:hypothetical protein